MTEPLPLTRRQREVLDFIVGYLRLRRIAPTLQEIADHFGFSSTASAQKHVLALQAKGHLQREKHRRRGLVPTGNEGGLSPLGHTVPLLGVVAAGQPIESLADREEITVPNELLGPGEHFVLRVRGDSMIDEGILDGDLVLVRARAEAAEGEVVVALIDGEVTLKRFFRDSERVVRLQPANAAMAPLRFPAERVAIQGIVTGLLRRYARRRDSGRPHAIGRTRVS